ncbi:unnamed protein product [Nezara viridula]|uniref:Androgen-dependent TFPI-regulating protein-like n=1 Tax=Nezara viridula TaxID=85310 RepID=A0A9P0HUG0_NEZVI|nr:unnamed protein product [Nezara viridula]
MVYFCSYSVIDFLEIYYLYHKKSAFALLLRQFLRVTVCNVLFSVVFPLSAVVAILFWGFYFWERELIYPKIMDNVLPPFINHMMHTYPVPLSIFYMFVEITEEPPKKRSFVLLTTLMSTYSFVFFYGNHNCDEWIYPVLDALTPSQATLVVIFTMTTPYVFLFVGYYIFSKIKDVRTYFNARLKKVKIY